jgi:serine/threonine-protein kinase RsbW
MAPSACKADQNRAKAAVNECVGNTKAVAITVPGEIEFRGLVLLAVASICKIACSDQAIASEFTHELVSAVGEGFNNAVIHSYAHMCGTVSLSLSFDSRHFVVELTENGEAFDPEGVQPFADDDLRESGFGLFIIRSFVDEMSYTAGPPNRLRMIKSLPGV